MRIGMFSCTYKRTNGVAVSLANLTKGLRDRGHEVHIFAPGSADRQDEFFHPFASFTSSRAPDYPVPLPNTPRAIRIAREVGIELVHTHHQWLMGDTAASVAEELDLPIVSTVHTQQEMFSRHLQPIPEWLVNWLIRWRLKHHLSRVDVVTTPGNGSRHRLHKMGIKVPIEVVTNGTDLEPFRINQRLFARRQLDIPEDALVLGYVGRLSREKNLPELIEAARLIFEDLPQCVLLVVGDGEMRCELEELAKYWLDSDRVIFTGRVAHSRVPLYLAAMDVFGITSMCEVQPMTLAEAGASALPVVAFDAFGCNDMVEHRKNGLLVDPSKGAVGFASGVLECMNDPALRRRLSRIAKSYAERWSIDRATEATLESYARAQHYHAKKRLAA